MNRPYPISFSTLALLALGALALPFCVVRAADAPARGGPPAPIRPPGAIADPPAVQMLAPGFTVRELPLKLRNLNNLVYAPDGRLFALGYDGNVYQLKDTDGDGLEDSSTLFYNNDTATDKILPSIGMAWGPNGLYIASRSRIIHLRDKGDGTGELITLAAGWPKSTVAAGSNLDAIGMAVDAQGNLYYGLGVDAYNGAYRVNRTTGKPDYNQFSERGAIVKMSADFKNREVIATGVRFTVSLAFNAAGDLFASDQEGATWLPNGNPFDELLHISKGRHYGFPPRHPEYLPGVIDEPSVFDYSPQHQSTCGIHFNYPIGGGTATFGPDWWKGDVFVAGESRGKIWRTKLVQTPAGYVAKNDLIACLTNLTIDATPTPGGDMLVICHTGAPDWGTGPRGQGRIFKISLADKNAPQPVLAYAASPTETRIVFDRPVDPAQWRNVARQSAITMGRNVSAGDRFESFVPNYQAVKDQALVQSYDVKVLSAGLSADLRTVTLTTAPRVDALHYAIKLPEGTAAQRPANAARLEITQHAAIDVQTDLSGVEAEFRDAAGKVAWAGWLPHVDLRVARELTAPSEEHRKLFELLKTPGTLRLRGQLDLNLMLRTAIQPGAKLDFEYPSETVTVALKSSGKLDLKTGANAKLDRRADGEIAVTTVSPDNGWLPFELTLATGAAEPVLDVAWRTAEDYRPRALPLRRVLMPFAKPAAAAPVTSPENRVIPEIAGGDWHRGQQVFKGVAACFACHQVNGEGGIIGPDLSNLTHRDYASVLKDIMEPSASINPDRIAYVLDLKDGTSVSGILLDDTPDSIIMGDLAGGKRPIAKAAIAGMKASAVSLMPEGLWNNLNTQQQRDLMTYLLTPAPAGAAK